MGGAVGYVACEVLEVSQLASRHLGQELRKKVLAL